MTPHPSFKSQTGSQNKSLKRGTNSTTHRHKTRPFGDYQDSKACRDDPAITNCPEVVQANACFEFGKKECKKVSCGLSHIDRFRMVKKRFPQNTFFSWFFTGRAFIMVYYIIKLDLEFQLDLQNPLKPPKMWIFEKWKIIFFGESYGIFWPRGGLKPCIIMYLGNIHNMSLVPVNFGNFFFQILQKWHFLG